MPRPDSTLEPPVDGEPTKRCPYCAEMIKAAAIKCRFCQSDLTLETTPPAESGEVHAPHPAESGEVHAPHPAESGEMHAPHPAELPVVGRESVHFSRLGRWWRVGVAVAVVLTLGFVGFAVKAWIDANELEQSADAGSTVRAAVSDKVETLLSYEYSSFDDDLADAEDVMTSSFQKEYAPTVEEIRDRAVQQKRSQEAQVSAVAVIDESPDEVSTLVFVDTASSTEGSKRQRLMQNRVEVTMVKQDGTWLIDDLSVPLS